MFKGPAEFGTYTNVSHKTTNESTGDTMVIQSTHVMRYFQQAQDQILAGDMSIVILFCMVMGCIKTSKAIRE